MGQVFQRASSCSLLLTIFYINVHYAAINPTLVVPAYIDRLIMVAFCVKVELPFDVAFVGT